MGKSKPCPSPAGSTLQSRSTITAMAASCPTFCANSWLRLGRKPPKHDDWSPHYGVLRELQDLFGAHRFGTARSHARQRKRRRRSALPAHSTTARAHFRLRREPRSLSAHAALERPPAFGLRKTLPIYQSINPIIHFPHPSTLLR